MNENEMKQQNAEENQVGKQQNAEENQVGKQQPKITAEDMLRRVARGKLQLYTPIRSGETEVRELAYDLGGVTTMEYIEAMDCDSEARNAFRISAKQALRLFAIAAGKETEGLDKYDILSRLSVQDSIKAVQVASSFFHGCTQTGQKRLTDR